MVRNWTWPTEARKGMTEVVKFVGRTERFKGLYGSIEIVESEPELES